MMQLGLLLAFGTAGAGAGVHLSLSVQLLGSKATSGAGAYVVASQTGSASEETT